MVLFIVDQAGLGDREGAAHVNAGCGNGILVLFQCIDVIGSIEIELTLFVIFGTNIERVARHCTGINDAVGICIGGVLHCFAVVNTEKCPVVAAEDAADTVEVVEIVAVSDPFQPVDRAAEVDHDRIIAHGFDAEIGAGTADIADHVQILPVLDDAHLTAHIAFFDHFIEDIHVAQTILGLSLIVNGIHDCQRTLVFEIGIDLLICEDAADRFVDLFLFSRFCRSGRGGLVLSGSTVGLGIFIVFGRICCNSFILLIRLF